MSRLRALKRLAPDPYIIAIFVMVGLATVLPVQGGAARAFALTTKAAIALLFFLHGARLSPEAVVGGLTHWRLHLLVLAATFVVFPLLGLMFARLPSAILPGALCAGLTFLCCLPSTVQSSIAFTAVARGNVAAAVCAASVSNLLGVVVTPVLAAAALGARGGQVGGLSAVGAVAAQLLAPFLAGQIARPWLAETLKRHGRLVGLVDRGSILLVVYGAFSASVADGLWSKISAPQLGALVALCGLLLGAVLAATAWATRALGFAREDQIAVVFCGSKKSLASGVPMASILFPPPMVGLIVLPLMIFHQMQLMACAVIAQRWAARPNA